jgi:hypothetical protein
MPEITRNRTIRPSTRKPTSTYRVYIKGTSSGDTLVVNIMHESRSFRKSYTFRGIDVAQKKSLGFKVTNHGTGIKIQWISTQPVKEQSK